MIIHKENLDIKQIAESGQCFRMNAIGDNKYSNVAYGRYIELTQIDESTVEFSCTEEEFNEIWKDYFDLSYDYKRIVDSLLSGRDDFLKKSAEYGKGIRILQQEPFEALISFIISQNKNIPAIKTCIEGICREYGDAIETAEGVIKEYYSFPSPKALALANKDDLRKLKTGYRDEYIIRAARAVYEGELDLKSLIKGSHEVAVEVLMGLKGVGMKVANCVSLFGLHHIEAFPVDVWIKKILDDVYDGKFD
ncbi:MAG TPA: DNA-3-methyladenine glycosylase 2 family protein, partial [Clostridiales bacterium]|nr:DNA-3-methyladenine glycosylase 2 family protein [Clostridiales bacterium]